ncbi:MAG: TMEM165/GDT1 family protein [Clostridia bacterium]|nr:TMEM165/GDT1 family protein [Clostridia bacterium]
MLFWKVMIAEFIAEMGDKTQLMLIAMTSRYKLRDIILGTAAAILVLNGLAVLAGSLLSELIPLWLMRLIAAAAFLFFAWSEFRGKEEADEEQVKEKKLRFAAASVFFTFFLAELGDKTQLTAVTFAANEGLSRAVIVWLACSAGLFAADLAGMAAGMLLKNKLPEGAIHGLAFVLFAFFGLVTLHEGCVLLLGGGTWPLILTISAGVCFALLCWLTFRKKQAAGD